MVYQPHTYTYLRFLSGSLIWGFETQKAHSVFISIMNAKWLCHQAQDKDNSRAHVNTVTNFRWIVKLSLFLRAMNTYGERGESIYPLILKFGTKLAWLASHSDHIPVRKKNPTQLPTWLGRAGQSVNQIPVGARFSQPVQTGPGAHPAPYTMCTGSLTGVRRVGRGVEHPPTTSAEVKERVELYLYSGSGPSWSILGWT
jgi:hypothetical protein